MPFGSNAELPDRVRGAIPSAEGKRLFREVVNSQLSNGRSDAVAFASAWAALANAGYEQNDSGDWVKKALPSSSDVNTGGDAAGVPRRFREELDPDDEDDEEDDEPARVGKQTFRAPKTARDNARKVLRWRDEHGDEVKGMTRVGWTRANQLASNEPLSLDTVKRMSQFARHRQNADVAEEYKGEPWKDAGHVAWLGWGGTAGVEWAQRIVRQQEERTDKRYMNDHAYTLPDEARSASFDLGFGGAIHTHQTADGQAVYMPGETHEEYLEGMSERAGIGAEGDDDAGWIPRLVEVLERLVGKQAGVLHDDGEVVEIEAEVIKVDEAQRLVYGWASVVTEDGEPVTDRQGDIIAPEELERAATEYMMDERAVKLMHEGEQVGVTVHSMPLTFALAETLGVDTNGREGWIIAQKITDDSAWAKFLAGDLRAFSVGGRAVREAV